MKPTAGFALVLFFFSLSTSSLAIPPVHMWSKGYGDADMDRGYSVVVDGVGDVIVTGEFTGTIDCGGGALTSATNFRPDIFLAKYDSNGNHIWSKRFGGTSADVPTALCVDASNNIFLTGSFFLSVNFGGGVLTSAGQNDIFLLKLTPAGAHVWSKRYGGAQSDSGLDVAVGAGLIALTGRYGPGTVSLGGAALPTAGSFDMFVAVYDASGTHQWSKGFADVSDQQGTSVRLDAAGNVIVAGFFQNTVDLGGGPLTSAGDRDALLAKFDKNGVHLWSERFGGTDTDLASSIALDTAGNIILAAAATGTSNFGGSTFVGAGLWGLVLAKYDANGVHQWSEQFGSIRADVGNMVVLDTSANIYLGGMFENHPDLGGGALANTGSEEIFLAKYDPSGAPLWSVSFGDSFYDGSSSIAAAGSGSIVMTGTFSGRVDFGGGPLTSAPVFGTFSRDAFVVKFADQPPLPVLIQRFNAAPRSHGVELSWQYASNEPLAGFSLFRTAGTAPAALIASGDARTRSYRDDSVAPGQTYQYELMIRTVGGDEFRSPRQTVTIPRAVTSLGPNHPNPFNPRTTIEYSVDRPGRIAIEIFDASGSRVRVLEAHAGAAGAHRIEWDGRDAKGRPVGSGVYFYRMAGVKGAETRKMVLLK
jgi:hypothetical protein